MTADLWTVFAAIVFPFVPYLVASYEKNRRGIYDPANPRDSNALLSGWALRAKGCEQNCWEALAAYLGVTFIAYQAGANPVWLSWLGGAWVLFRLAYILAYVSGAGLPRIALWSAGLLLTLGRFMLVFAPHS